MKNTLHAIIAIMSRLEQIFSLSEYRNNEKLYPAFIPTVLNDFWFPLSFQLVR